MNKVKIKLHGALAKDAGRSEWNLRVKNVREAISGVQCHWKKFYSSLVENNKKHIGYRVLINGEECLVEEGKDPNSREGMRSSQLSLDEISNSIVVIGDHTLQRVHAHSEKPDTLVKIAKLFGIVRIISRSF